MTYSGKAEEFKKLNEKADSYYSTNQFDKGVACFLKAYEVDFSNKKPLLNCGVGLWLGALHYLFQLSHFVIKSCNSQMQDELFLTYLINNKNFPGGVFANELRDCVPDHCIEKLSEIVSTAEECFKYSIKNDGGINAYQWIITLLRGTGRWEEYSKYVEITKGLPTITAEKKNKLDNWTSRMSVFRDDLKLLDSAPGGWPSFSTAFLDNDFLNHLFKSAKVVSNTMSNVRNEDNTEDNKHISPKIGMSNNKVIEKGRRLFFICVSTVFLNLFLSSAIAFIIFPEAEFVVGLGVFFLLIYGTLFSLIYHGNRAAIIVISLILLVSGISGFWRMMDFFDLPGSLNFKTFLVFILKPFISNTLDIVVAVVLQFNPSVTTFVNKENVKRQC